MNRRALAVAAGAGLVAQLALAVLGHFIPFVADYLFPVVGAAISLGVGAIYFRKAPGVSLPMMGGAAAAALCAFGGMLLSVLLGDVHPLLLPLGTLGSGLGGAAGAALARTLKARRRR